MVVFFEWERIELKKKIRDICLFVEILIFFYCYIFVYEIDTINSVISLLFFIVNGDKLIVLNYNRC